MTQEALKELLDAVEAAIQAGDWKVDGACDPDLVIRQAKEALAEHAMSKVQRIGQEIEQGADSFCDSHCSWTDHHPDCKLAQPEQIQPSAYSNTHQLEERNQ